MENVNRLLEAGAYSCAGDLILNGKVMAQLRDGQVILTDEGRTYLSVEDAVIKRVETPRRGRPPKVLTVQQDDDAQDNQ